MAKTKDPKAERHQVILAEILKEEDNKFCADCAMKGENLYESRWGKYVSKIKTLKYNRYWCNG